jgi:hypothetical protein
MPDNAITVSVDAAQANVKRHLLYCYGEPDRQEMVGIEVAAGLIMHGHLELAIVEDAIDAGWDPGSQHILAFLAMAPLGPTTSLRSFLCDC